MHGHVTRSECRTRSQYKIHNSCFERVESFKYLTKTLTNQISIPGVIKFRSKPGNACFYSVQKFVFRKLQRLKYKEFSFCFCYGYETWSPKLREERGLRLFDNSVLRRIFEPKRAQ